MKIPEVDRFEVLKNININYSASTGYRCFENYDIYGLISYYVYVYSQDTKIKHIAKEILKGCANYRFHSANLLGSINKEEI